MTTISFTGDDFRIIARGYSRPLMFRYMMRSWPSDILNLLGGNYEEGMTRVMRWWLSDDIDHAAYNHYECGSGRSAERLDRLESDTGHKLIGHSWGSIEESCKAWSADLGEAFRSGFETSIPSLLIHGTWDVNTPIENAEELRPFFKNHKYVVVHGGSHGAWREAEELVDGFQSSVLKWMTTGEFDAMPDEVTLPPLEWDKP